MLRRRAVEALPRRQRARAPSPARPPLIRAAQAVDTASDWGMSAFLVRGANPGSLVVLPTHSLWANLTMMPSHAQTKPRAETRGGSVVHPSTPTRTRGDGTSGRCGVGDHVADG